MKKLIPILLLILISCKEEVEPTKIIKTGTININDDLLKNFSKPVVYLRYLIQEGGVMEEGVTYYLLAPPDLYEFELINDSIVKFKSE